MPINGLEKTAILSKKKGTSLNGRGERIRSRRGERERFFSFGGRNYPIKQENSRRGRTKAKTSESRREELSGETNILCSGGDRIRGGGTEVWWGCLLLRILLEAIWNREKYS